MTCSDRPCSSAPTSRGSSVWLQKPWLCPYPGTSGLRAYPEAESLVYHEFIQSLRLRHVYCILFFFPRYFIFIMLRTLKLQGARKPGCLKEFPHTVFGMSALPIYLRYSTSLSFAYISGGKMIQKCRPAMYILTR